MAAFPKTNPTIGRTDQPQKVTQMMPGSSAGKTEQKKKAAPAVEKCGLFSFSADEWAH